MIDTVVVTSADDEPAVLVPTIVDAVIAAQNYAGQTANDAASTTTNAASAANSANAAASSAAIAYARIGISDDNYIGQASDVYVGWTAITAPRVYTLPLASTYRVGRPLTVADESGNCSSTNTITIYPAGSDVIVGVGTNPSIVAPGGALQFYATPAGKWIMKA